VHIGYPIPAGRIQANVLLDIFNLLNAQRPILVDERWASRNPKTPPPLRNPNYGKAVIRNGAIAARLGVRLSF